MLDIPRLVVAVFAVAIIAPMATIRLRADDEVDFNRDIRPLLARNCFACHGMDPETREADLRLDERQPAIESGAIIPEDPDGSELVVRVLSKDPDSVMPPPESGHVLSEADISLLRKWISEGAEFAVHWSFSPPIKTELPNEAGDWSTHPIDRFVFHELEKAGLSPNPEAERLLLLRRLALDLTGLPPTVDQADAFLADESPDAYEKAVDRLLESSAYGEHWARTWLDLARYADTKGYEKDRPRTIWRYRDWVIDALNRDLSYDEFTTQQLAGDLLPDATRDQILATAFHRNTMENDEGGTDDEEFRVAAVKDRVDTTMQVWMGLTMGCAKCHSHKYDPISQKDYYAFYDFFNQTEDADRQQPIMQTPTTNQAERITTIENEIKSLRHQIKQKPEGYQYAWNQWQTQFKTKPLWSPLQKLELEAKHPTRLTQDDDGVLRVEGELPDKDTWKLTLSLPKDAKVTAIRFDVFPKPKGGKWPDKNVALRELTAELVSPGQPTVKLKLVRPRADFSQRGWEVAKAIDGKNNAGWAFSPRAAEPHCAIFDFEHPIDPSDGRELRLTIEQEYGQGLLLKDFRVSVSSYPTDWLQPTLDPIADLPNTFQRSVFSPTKTIHAQIETKQQELESAKRNLPTTPIMRELAAAKRRKTRIHNRGNFLDQGDVVDGRVPIAFGSLSDDAPRNRLGVAQWLMSDENPLTARVAVNRIWAQLFGIGLVETEEDFGTQGTLPSHPELLDWLAVEFRDTGWSMKSLVKTIVMSKTYRQDATTTKQHLALDPRNRLLSRGPRFRLSAEMVRDQALAVSGLLTREIGGPSVMPPQPDGIWKSTYSGEKWRNASGPNRYRRALYTYKKRTSPYPAMMTFDSGSGEVCQVRRIRTNTPLQALVTLNDTAFVEAAGALAKRMQAAATTPRQQIASGFRYVLIRPADANELEFLIKLYDSLQDDLAEGKALLRSAGLSEGDPRLVAVANVLLNLDETLTKP